MTKSDQELRDELASKYAERFPTKQEWIQGRKDTHSYLSYEVRYQVDQAFCDGWDAAVHNMNDSHRYRKALTEIDQLKAMAERLANDLQGWVNYGAGHTEWVKQSIAILAEYRAMKK